MLIVAFLRRSPPSQRWSSPLLRTMVNINSIASRLMIAFYITIVFHVFFVVTIIFVLLFQSWSHSLITEKSPSKETKMSVLDSTCSARLEGGTLALL